MIKAKKFDINSTNIALLGSDLEKNVRLNAAEKEEAWNGIGKVAGIEVWRIESFKVVAWPKDKYGSFFSGDSYIVLRSYKAKPEDRKLSYDVHFWLGKETSQDEAGTAAYKTVELDDYLGGLPVQHREVQGYESELFLSYFPKFQVVEGGVQSGFAHVKPTEYRHRLLHIKGNKNRLVVREVPKTYQSLNSGDVFLLDAGLKVFQWNGKGASGPERHKGAELATAITNERKGQAKVSVFIEGDGDLSAFWELLGGEGPVASADDGAKEAEAVKGDAKRLIRVTETAGKISYKEESSGVVRKSQFDTNDTFIFDAGFEVFAWIGKKTTPMEKRMAIQAAQDYLAKYKRPMWLPISRILEGAENAEFASCLDPEEQKGYVPKKKIPGAPSPIGSKDNLAAPGPQMLKNSK